MFITSYGLEKATVIESPLIVIPSAAEESQNVISAPIRLHAKRSCMYGDAKHSNRFRFLGCARNDTSVGPNDGRSTAMDTSLFEQALVRIE